MKQNKYEYLWVLQGNYGYGWDDLFFAETAKEGKQTLKCYRENKPSNAHRLIQRRVLKEVKG